MSKAVLKGSAGPWVLAASTEECILGKKSGSQAGGKSERSQQPPTKCPECSSLRIWKDGLRYVKSETGTIAIQRYICRSCARRFSETEAAPPNTHRQKPSPRRKKNVDLFGSYLKPITSHYKANGLTSTCQVCVSDAEMENLAKVETRQEVAQREGTKPDTKTVKGLIVQYAYWLEKEGYYRESVYLTLIRILAKNGANLLDPENVKAVIARQPWKNSTKILAVYAYNAMTKMLNIEWSKPKYRAEETLPFIPEEAELDQLIASCRSRRMAAFLQTLKETFADPGEALRLRWIDISDNVITINSPVKGHNPRQLKVSSKLIAMLNALPKTAERVFPTTYNIMATCFWFVKHRAARQLQNPRLLKISFRTFRHWGATMVYHYSHGNILLVKKLLGHKNINSTMKYTQLVHFKDDEFDVATATTIKEAKPLAAAGFEYITEKNGIMLWRKPKTFNV